MAYTKTLPDLTYLGDQALSSGHHHNMRTAMQRRIWRLVGTSSDKLVANTRTVIASAILRRHFHSTRRHAAIKPYLLADIGEGITECQIVSWLVKPGDRVQQFDAICEVQSDKASVEITSRFDGVIQKLHYEVDDMAAVGAPLVDIDVEEDDQAANTTNERISEAQTIPGMEDTSSKTVQGNTTSNISVSSPEETNPMIPAVRRMIKEHSLSIGDIRGTGKGGRVLKDDVQRHLASIALPAVSDGSSAPAANANSLKDEIVPLSPIQKQMFQSMTRSLAIPHFQYTHIVDMTDLTALRRRFTENPAVLSHLVGGRSTVPRLTPLPFILKALCQAISKFPTMNASLDTETNPDQPQLVIKGQINIGIAVDTSKGLVVPVIRNVANHSILSLAAELERLGTSARDGKLSPDDMKGASIVVSNIGSIGGHTVGPVILAPNVIILGIGRSRDVPTFRKDQNGTEHIVKREQVVLSWSADHRVLDGATVAKCAQEVGTWIENIDGLGMALR